MLGLEYLHENRIVWYDGKSRNLVWTKAANIKLIDFNHSGDFQDRPPEDLDRAKQADYDCLASQIWLMAVSHERNAVT